MSLINRSIGGGRPIAGIAQQSNYEIEWDAGSGPVWSRSWFGRRQDLEAMMPGMKSTHDRLSLRAGKTDDDWTLTASITDSQTRIVQFALQSSQLQQSIYLSQRVKSLVGGTANLMTVKAAAESVKNSSSALDVVDNHTQAIDDIETAITDPTYQANALTLLELLLRDTDSILEWSYSFTKTISLSRWNVDEVLNFNGVKKIYSRDEMIAETGYEDLTDNIPNVQWLKEAPSSDITLGSRRVDTYKWIGADVWSPLLYDTVSGVVIP